jgi:hypothetical protein
MGALAAAAADRMTRWSNLTDGMPDPRFGGERLATQRQTAIRDALRLMGCTHRRSENCDHVDAITAMASAMTETAAFLLVEGIRELPRPLKMADIERLPARIAIVTMLPEQTDERR